MGKGCRNDVSTEQLSLEGEKKKKIILAKLRTKNTPCR
jgi:hypothetical protein